MAGSEWSDNSRNAQRIDSNRTGEPTQHIMQHCQAVHKRCTSWNIVDAKEYCEQHSNAGFWNTASQVRAFP